MGQSLPNRRLAPMRNLLGFAFAHAAGEACGGYNRPVQMPDSSWSISGANEPIHGRGVSSNPRNRFVPLTVLPDPDAVPFDDDGESSPKTQFLKDSSRSII